MDVLMWSLAMMGQTGFVFFSVNQLTIISEFEDQTFGPTDFTNQLNEFVTLDHGGALAVAALHLAFGPRLFGLALVPLAAFCFIGLRRGSYLLDVTDCYRLLQERKREYRIRVGLHGVLLVVTAIMFMSAMSAEIQEHSGGEPLGLAMHHSLLF